MNFETLFYKIVYESQTEATLVAVFGFSLLLYYCVTQGYTEYKIKKTAEYRIKILKEKVRS